MSSPQQISDDIRLFISGTDQRQSADLDELAAGYADWCRKANLRLRRCSEYLGRGLIAEAVHEAKQPPDLLDLVTALDIPDLARWEEACQLYNLPRPQRLLIELAGELNEAYAAEEPLRVLLDNQRLLVLSRASLSPRLTAVRALAAADPATPHWQEDVKSFEDARYEEIQGEALSVMQRGDLAGVSRLLDELEPSLWQSPPPKDLVRKLRAVEVKGLSARMASANGSLAALKEATHSLRSTVSKRRVKLDPATQARLTEAEAATQFEDLCHRLKQEIDGGGDPSLIRALHREVSSFSRPMLPEVYDAWKQWSHAQGEKRRRATIWMVAAAGVVLVIAIFLVVYSHRAQAADRVANEWSRRVHTAIDSRDWDGGREYLKQAQADASIANHPAITLANTDFETAWSKEQKRLEDLEAALEEAETAGAAGRPFAPAIDRAISLTINNQEKLRVRRLEDSLRKQFGAALAAQPEPVAAQSPTPPREQPEAQPAAGAAETVPDVDVEEPESEQVVAATQEPAPTDVMPLGPSSDVAARKPAEDTPRIGFPVPRDARLPAAQGLDVEVRYSTPTTWWSEGASMDAADVAKAHGPLSLNVPAPEGWQAVKMREPAVHLVQLRTQVELTAEDLEVIPAEIRPPVRRVGVPGRDIPAAQILQVEVRLLNDKTVQIRTSPTRKDATTQVRGGPAAFEKQWELELTQVKRMLERAREARATAARYAGQSDATRVPELRAQATKLTTAARERTETILLPMLHQRKVYERMSSAMQSLAVELKGNGGEVACVMMCEAASQEAERQADAG